MGMNINSPEAIAAMKKDPVYGGEEARKDLSSHLAPKEGEFVFDDVGPRGTMTEEEHIAAYEWTLAMVAPVKGEPPVHLELNEINGMTSLMIDELDLPKPPYPKKPLEFCPMPDAYVQEHYRSYDDDHPTHPVCFVLTCPSKEERAEREAFERSVKIAFIKSKEQRDRSMQKKRRR